MTIITDIRESRKQKLARCQPLISFLSFSATALLDEIHEKLFPDVDQTVELYFVTRGPLAFIAHNKNDASIYIHQLLNHSDTPIEVIVLILKHELLHLRIPPTIENGKRESHPPAFWAAEKAIAPDRDSAWAWVWQNLWSCVKQRPELQRIDVLPGWKRVWNQPKTDIATCVEMVARPEQVTEESGW